MNTTEMQKSIPAAGYHYQSSVKSRASDELLNTYLLRPIAGQIVRLLYHTSITPNHLTLVSICAGAIAAYLYLQNQIALTILAGLFITLKDLLDSADGQLARAKSMYTRSGRFLDSIGDFVVNLMVFAAISFTLVEQTGNQLFAVLGLLCFLGISLRVSYHVFYQTSYLHLHQSYQLNRLTEEITDQDDGEDQITIRLQKVFLILYGWQDRLMVRLDAWSRKGLMQIRGVHEMWYEDRVALRLSGLIGLGTELFVLMIFSLADSLLLYFYVNVVLMNLVWLFCVAYRRLVLRPRIGRIRE